MSHYHTETKVKQKVILGWGWNFLDKNEAQRKKVRHCLVCPVNHSILPSYSGKKKHN